jgi:predicted permease
VKLLHRLGSVLHWIARRSEAEQQLDQELQSFLDMSVADKIAEGLPPVEARRLAKLELGGVEQVKERVRRYRHGGRLDEIGRDVRYAFRLFVKNRGFTATVVLTLALGIGANTAIFSLIDALMLRWLPVPNPQELLQVSFHTPGSPRPAGVSFSYVIVRGLAERRDIFSGVAGFVGTTLDVGPPGSISRVPGALVTGGYYPTLGLNALVGRLLGDDDDRSGAPLTAVISYGYWQREFAGSPQAVGQSVKIKGVPVTVVGVTPRDFVGANVGAIADITMALGAFPQVNPGIVPLLGPGNFWLRALARPTPGVSAEEATSRLNAVWPHISDPLIAPHWSASERKSVADSVFQLTPGGTGWTYLREIYRKPLFVLMGAVALVLLIACANVATLLLARASSRQREVAVRLAIGAGRGRIVRQLLVESTMLSLTGAAVGVGLAWWCGRFLVSLISTGPGSVEFDLTPNWHILVFSSAAAIATGVLFGIAPAMQTTAIDPAVALKENSKGTGSRSRLLPFLVTGQVALSLVVLAAAGVFARTLNNLQSLDPGFHSGGVLLVELDDRRNPLPPAILQDVARLPGVLSTSVSTHTPLNGWTWTEPAVPAGQPIPERDNAYFIGGGPRFFSTLQIQLLAGREFSDQDRMDSPLVAIVNQAYAEHHFAHQNPVGEHLSARVNGNREDLEIIGVVRNTNIAGLRTAPPQTVYVAYYQLKPDIRTTVSVRAAAPLGPVSSELRQIVQSIYPASRIEVRSLAAQVGDTMVQERMMATLAGGFGLLALTLACIGIYGLLAYSVARRTREIGIRMALGAHSRSVVASVVTRGTRLVLLGVAAGLPLMWIGSRSIESLLFGVRPIDPATIAGAIAVLLIAAQLAAYLPARRASRVDPLEALRHE